jgi:transmembrane sensor
MNAPDSRDEQAAFWFLRLCEADVEVDEIDQAMAWLAQSADNQAAFDRVERTWHVGDDVSVQQVRDLADVDTAVDTAPRFGWLRRPVFRTALAAGLAALLATAAVTTINDFLEPAAPERYATMIGETRTVTLPDGSQVTLGGASSVSVEYQQKVRRVVLTDGEALFDVAKNPRRPFIVEAAGGSVQALGTVFDVHREPEGVTVKVAEGAVQVRTGPAEMRLQAGHQVTYSMLTGLGPLRTVDPGRVASWRKGVLVFIDRPLASVVVDLNRYSPRVITVQDDAIRQVHVTGSVTVDGITEWLHALRDTAAVDVVESGRDLILRRAPADRNK